MADRLVSDDFMSTVSHSHGETKVPEIAEVVIPLETAKDFGSMEELADDGESRPGSSFQGSSSAMLGKRRGFHLWPKNCVSLFLICFFFMSNN